MLFLFFFSFVRVEELRALKLPLLLLRLGKRELFFSAEELLR
jgi:hypothetical protein